MSNLFIDIGARTTNFDRSMQHVKQIVSSVAGSLGVGLSLGGLGYGLVSIIENLDNIYDSSKKLQVTTDYFQKMAYAASLAGVETNTVINTIAMLEKNIGKALNNPEGDMAGYFNRLGLSVEKLKNMKPEDALSAFAQSINKIVDPFEKMEIGAALMGRNFKSILPMISEWDEVSKQIADREFVSEEDIKAAHELSDAWKDIKNSFLVIVANTGLFQSLADGLSTLISDLKNMIQMYKDIKKGSEDEKKAAVIYKNKNFLGLENINEPYIAAPTKEEIATVIANKKNQTTNTNNNIAQQPITNFDLEEEIDAKQQKLDDKLSDQIEEQEYQLELLQAKNNLSEKEFERQKIIMEYDKKIADAKDDTLQTILEGQKQEELSILDRKQEDERQKEYQKMLKESPLKQIGKPDHNELPVRGMIMGTDISKFSSPSQKLETLQEKSVKLIGSIEEVIKRIDQKNDNKTSTYS